MTVGFDLSSWGSQRLMWTERMRGCALTWPRCADWFTNDPLDHAPHSHPNASEIYFVASGALEVVVGDESMVLQAGDICLIPPGAYHDPRGTLGEDLALFCTVAPNWRERRWQTEGFPAEAFEARAVRGRVDSVGELPSDALLRCACEALAPGEHQDHPPIRGRERVVYILEGELTCRIDQMTGIFGPHSYVPIPSNASHSLRNDGPGPVLLLSIWAADPAHA